MLTLTPKKMNLMSNLTFLTDSYAVRESMETYQEKVLAVTNYCNEMTKLPDVTLKNPADWYTMDFMQTYSKARSFPSSWTSANGILDQLNQIPEHIVEYDSMFQGLKDIIKSDAQIIIDAPSPKLVEDAKKQLSKYLSTLKQAVCGYQEQTAGICSKISDFKASINKYGQFFKTLYTESKDTKKADDELIKSFNKQMDQLNQDIKKWNAVRTAMYVSMGVTGIAIVISLGCGPIGIIVGICCGVGLIAEGITAIVADETIKEDQEKLRKVTEQFDSYTADASVLDALVKKLDTLDKMLGETLQAIEGIDKAWKQLDTNIDTLVCRLKEAEEDEEKALYQDLINIMDQADTDWNAVVEAAKQLNGTREEIDTENVYPVEFAS